MSKPTDEAPPALSTTTPDSSTNHTKPLESPGDGGDDLSDISQRNENDEERPLPRSATSMVRFPQQQGLLDAFETSGSTGAHSSSTNASAAASVASGSRNTDPFEEGETKVFRIVLTGGPCAGKSTVMSLLQQRIPQRYGIKVYCVPEAASLMVNAGVEWSDDPNLTIHYQLALLRIQLSLEDQFYNIAKASGRTSLVVSDRGTMDGRAFTTTPQFNEILRLGGFTIEQLRDDRYDAVVHMVTAAQGKPEFYNFDNPARFESVEEARVNDDRLRKMYVGHRLIRVFDNSGPNLQYKLDRVLEFVGQVCGRSFPTHKTRRLLVEAPDHNDDTLPPSEPTTTTTTILNNSSSDEVKQVVKRHQGNMDLFFYQCMQRKINHSTKKSEATRTVHRLSSREYASLISQRDPDRVDVVKNYHCFMYETLYCELCDFSEPSWANNKCILYAECQTDDDKMPPFLKVIRDVSNSTFLSSYYLSDKSIGPQYADVDNAPTHMSLSASVGGKPSEAS